MLNKELNKEYKWLWFQQRRCHIKCPCGSKYLEYNKKNHLKTSKHKNYLQNSNPVKNIFVKKSIITWSLP